MATPFDFDVCTEANAVVLQLSGQLDVATADLDRFAEAVQDGDGMVVVDMSELTFVDSTGLGLLVGFQTLVNTAGRAFALRSPTRRVEQLMALTGLDRVLGVERA
jgi:anti-sigma B factor antagonist